MCPNYEVHEFTYRDAEFAGEVAGGGEMRLGSGGGGEGGRRRGDGGGGMGGGIEGVVVGEVEEVVDGESIGVLGVGEALLRREDGVVVADGFEEFRGGFHEENS